MALSKPGSVQANTHGKVGDDFVDAPCRLAATNLAQMSMSGIARKIGKVAVASNI
jgi:hypothetical protein